MILKKTSSSHTQSIGTDLVNSWSVIVERICTPFTPEDREDTVAHELNGTFLFAVLRPEPSRGVLDLPFH